MERFPFQEQAGFMKLSAIHGRLLDRGCFSLPISSLETSQGWRL